MVKKRFTILRYIYSCFNRGIDDTREFFHDHNKSTILSIAFYLIYGFMQWIGVTTGVFMITIGLERIALQSRYNREYNLNKKYEHALQTKDSTKEDLVKMNKTILKENVNHIDTIRKMFTLFMKMPNNKTYIEELHKIIRNKEKNKEGDTDDQ